MAFAAAAVMFLAALAITATAINTKKQHHTEGTPTVHMG